MAEYVVAFVLDKIGTHLIEEARSMSRVSDQIEWIEAELKRMQSFLKDADAKQDADERVKNWVTDVRDVAYDTEDVIDSLTVRASRGRRKEFVVSLKRYTLFPKELMARRNIDDQMKRIKIRIHDITDSRSSYGIENIGKGKDGNRLGEKRRSSSHPCEEDIVGLEEHIRTLESRLIHGDSERSVISIIGMAGLGKTTLAKKVYLSSDVKKNFDCFAWVYVSQEYRAKDTLHELGKKLTGFPKTELEKMSKDELGETVSRFLEDKRYVIVLDDIWRIEVWDDLKTAFPDSKNRSRIMLTTRFRDVALHADPKSIPHELSLLSDEDSWELFCNKVCLEWNSGTSLPPWCSDLGQQIVKKCGGLPLAIVVLGGLLSRKDATFSEWLKVLQSVHWQLKHDPTQCAEILALSYSDLPYYLKSCFLYFGLFPEDYEILAERLKLLWVAATKRSRTARRHCRRLLGGANRKEHGSSF